MLAVVALGLWLRLRGRLYDSGAFLRLCQICAPLGFPAVIAGWTTTEVGRQPWTVYGLLRTADSVTPSLTTRDVAVSIAAYIVVYLVVFPAGALVMARIIRKGPTSPEAFEAEIESGRPAAPITVHIGDPEATP